MSDVVGPREKKRNNKERWKSNQMALELRKPAGSKQKSLQGSPKHIEFG